jgi:hypothetical protein
VTETKSAWDMMTRILSPAIWKRMKARRDAPFLAASRKSAPCLDRLFAQMLAQLWIIAPLHASAAFHVSQTVHALCR